VSFLNNIHYLKGCFGAFIYRKEALYYLLCMILKGSQMMDI
jgi:hypothetical protein